MFETYSQVVQRENKADMSKWEQLLNPVERFEGVLCTLLEERKRGDKANMSKW